MIFQYTSAGPERNPVLGKAVSSLLWTFSLCVLLTATAMAQDSNSRSSLDDPDEPSNLLPRIDERRTQKDSIFSVSPLGGLHDGAGKAKQDLYQATGLNLGFAITHLFQGVSEALPGEDDWGTATTTDLLGSWDLIDKGGPKLGQVVFHVQGRWNYGTTDPENLGFVSLASAIGTANTFAEYKPTFILRNLYWRQGSPEAGWAYRFGKITPDALLASSAHIGASTTFLSTASTGPFSIALPDSGAGVVGAWYINDRTALVGLFSDANADRFDFGEPNEGDFFSAAEIHFKIAPRTPKAGFSKLTLWHNDGSKDGNPINGMTGKSGWGVFVKHEQELSDDGRAVGILRFGKSFEDSAIYDRQASAHFLFYEPRVLTRLKNDVVGVAFNWAKLPVAGARNEYDVEVFYRFPLFPALDTTLSYQSIFNPALTRDIDHASVFSLRIRAVF